MKNVISIVLLLCMAPMAYAQQDQNQL
ncbi:MAG: hypothetical protein RL751_1622, partial [Bacteroidota bacterium]